MAIPRLAATGLLVALLLAAEAPAGYVAGEPQGPPQWLLDQDPAAGMPPN